MAVEGYFGGRTHRLADLLVIGELARHRRVGNREIEAVAGAHAERPVAIAHRGLRSIGSQDRSWPSSRSGSAKETVEESAWTSSAAIGKLPILRPALALPERDENVTSLAFAVGGVALHTLQVGEHAVEIGTRLCDLIVDRAALRRGTAEQREEAAAFAAQAPGLCALTVELGLLAASMCLQASELLGAGRVVSAAVDRRQLTFQPNANRIAGCCAGRSRRNGLLCGRRGQRNGQCDRGRCQCPQYIGAPRLGAQRRCARWSEDHSLNHGEEH